jgi:flagellar biosynthesis chaperone FliJ
MFEDYKKFIDRVVWGFLATAGIVIFKYIEELNKNTRDLSLQLSRLTTQVEYHETQLKSLNETKEVIFRVESELGMHQKRISIIQQKIK